MLHTSMSAKMDELSGSEKIYTVHKPNSKINVKDRYQHDNPDSKIYTVESDFDLPGSIIHLEENHETKPAVIFDNYQEKQSGGKLGKNEKKILHRENNPSLYSSIDHSENEMDGMNEVHSNSSYLGNDDVVIKVNMSPQGSGMVLEGLGIVIDDFSADMDTILNVQAVEDNTSLLDKESGCININSDENGELTTLQNMSHPEIESQIDNNTQLSDTDTDIQQPEEKFKCSLCPAVFSKKNRLVAHSKMHLPLESNIKSNKVFKCEVCLKTFTRKYTLNKHMSVHSDDRPFSCEVCSRTFRWKCDLTSHMSIHTDTKPLECGQCNKVFIWKCDLTRHQKMHEDQKPNTISCDICFKTFNQKMSLNAHMRVHCGDKKPFSCVICGTSFTKKSNLTVHMKVHNGEQSFDCDVCGKSFSQKRYLVPHMNLHSLHKAAELSSKA